MSVTKYRFQQTKNQRWGIYFEDRLLATVGSYEACLSIQRSLGQNLSPSDIFKIAIAYKQSIDRSLAIN